jgi:diadenosine tetraphosphate (Ap4A) HIT family hydrolase
MATHQDPCPICDQITMCENGTHPRLIAEMETGWAVMGESQFFRGYSLLLCKTSATELDELPAVERLRYLEEMALLARAVREVVQPHKLNYECLGNQAHHLHWHVFPRHHDDPHPRQPVWTFMPEGEAAEPYAFDEQRHGDLLASLRAVLARA